MTVTTELKEIKEMLRKIIRDMTKIRESQRQMKEEMYEVKGDLRRFRDLWKKEKAEIENRLAKLEEDKVKRELVQRLVRFEKMDEAIELKEKRSIGLPGSESSLRHSEQLQKCIESIVKRGRQHGSTVNIEYKKLCTNEKNMILKDGQRLIRHFFGSRKTDL
ncbi:uncharacterized protein LOC131675011 [Phymastichus coffea]|uniref:uncharacterized protein LOC131675011 n=1 Tax=Phymastichus coffea TaxID=108790 RepID=UPI00273B7F1A|nr:uncharacterized protein LOC131675011 [Phymastichus coffea]